MSQPSSQTGTATTAIALEDDVLQEFEELLAKCRSDNLPKLLTLVIKKLATGSSAHNAQRCFLLKLPVDLLIKIGDTVMESSGTETQDKERFGVVLPLMQTCKELRLRLQPLRLTRWTYTTSSNWYNSFYDDVVAEIRERQRLDHEFHEGPIQVLMQSPYHSYLRDPSSAAAMAGALECAIHGQLLRRPCVYIKCMTLSRTLHSDDEIVSWYVGHSREKYVIEETLYWRAGGREARIKTLGREEGIAIWQKATNKADGYL